MKITPGVAEIVVGEVIGHHRFGIELRLKESWVGVIAYVDNLRIMEMDKFRLKILS